MDALVDEIVERTRLTRDQAAAASKAAVDFIKERVPSTTASRIDGVLAGETVEETAKRVAAEIESAFRR